MITGGSQGVLRDITMVGKNPDNQFLIHNYGSQNLRTDSHI
jgi:hypothetical protein